MRFFHRFNIKIFIFIIFIGIIPATILVPMSLWTYQRVVVRSEGQDIMAEALVYNNEIVTSGFVSGNSNDALYNQLLGAAESMHGRIMIINSSLRVVKDTYTVDEGKTVIWENVVRSSKGESLYHYDEPTNYLIVSVPLTSSDGEVVGVLLLNKPMDYMVQNSDEMMSYGLISIFVIAVLSFLLGIVVSVHYKRPMSRMSAELDKIMAEHSMEIPEFPAFDELAEIRDKTNAVVKKLKSIDESRQEFVSNVSHELKTPLTSMKVLADSLNAPGMDVPLEMYQEFMRDIGDEIDRETKIINDLLSLVRMDKSNAQLNITAVNINSLIELVLKRVKPIAEKAEVEVIFESFRPVICEVDEVKFTLVVTNLVENAIKYNNAGGWVHVTLNSDHQYCYIKVEDNGLGIPEDSVEHIFERFYRADKSHSREIGGTGLGLAITKSAIAMHKGDIKVHSVLGEGSTFDVRVPLNYIVEQEAGR